jgi:putative membrane protein
MTTSELLAANNAFLNASSGVCLALAVRAIRAGDRALHRKLMFAALTCSALFLMSYLVRVALFPSRPFPGVGAARTVYFVILISHMVLAMVVPPLALTALWLSEVKQRFEAHRRVARVAFPIWMYVSVTGVVVYAMLFHWPVS